MNQTAYDLYLYDFRAYNFFIINSSYCSAKKTWYRFSQERGYIFAGFQILFCLASLMHFCNQTWLSRLKRPWMFGLLWLCHITYETRRMSQHHIHQDMIHPSFPHCSISLFSHHSSQKTRNKVERFLFFSITTQKVLSWEAFFYSCVLY